MGPVQQFLLGDLFLGLSFPINVLREIVSGLGPPDPKIPLSKVVFEFSVGHLVEVNLSVVVVVVEAGLFHD